MCPQLAHPLLLLYYKCSLLPPQYFFISIIKHFRCTPIISMATLSKLLLASLLISLLSLHHTVEAVEGEAKQQGSLVQMIDCNGACGARCRLSSRPNLCKRACGTCCRRCNCVPPGTAGNQQVCPCYYNMTTHGGRRKCP